MLTRLKGGRIVDPVTGRDGAGDLYLEDGHVVVAPGGREPDETIDVTGKIVMAGAIDVHSHIAGGNVGTARMMLPEHPAVGDDHAGPGARGGWTAYETGRRYAQMGFTTVIEPAMLPQNAFMSHLEMADIPIIDTAGLMVLGNDDYLLQMIAKKATGREIADYVGWMLDATRCIGVKVINAGGATAFKYNARTFSLDDEVPLYGTSSRTIMTTLQKAAQDLGVPHPAHVHINNLGVPGNVTSAIDSMNAAEGLPIHFAHIQFYGYGRQGKRGMSSAALQITEHLKQHPNVTVDVGQVMFGQTVTISCDILRQFDGKQAASPKKWTIWDGDANGGGIVPYHYKANSFANAIQWAVGLEVFLTAHDFNQVLFTTDHPNGAHFSRYPEIFHLLMSADERARWIEKLPRAARNVTNLAEIGRELTLTEIATMTRAAPAKLLGFTDRGHLKPGAVADVAVYNDIADKHAMFSAAHMVFKNGRKVVEDGEVVRHARGRAFTLDLDYDKSAGGRIDDFYQRHYGASADRLKVTSAGFGPRERFQVLS